MNPLELPHRRLPPQTEANLHVAISTVARILGIGEVPEYVLDYLMDDVADSLTKQQRRDPLAILSPEVLGRIQDRVKLSYGLGQPVNIHAAPVPKAAQDAADAGTGVADKDGSPFKRNRYGESEWDYLARATSGLRFRDIDPRYWNPATGVPGLTDKNFPDSPYAGTGLDLPTVQYLFYQKGFDGTQILHAGQDAKALGLNTKDRQTVEDFATLDRFDPTGRQQRADANKAWADWVAQNRDKLNTMLADIDDAPDEPTRQRRLAAYNQFVQKGMDQTGQTKVDQRLQTVEPDPDAPPGERPKAINAQANTRLNIMKSQGVSAQLVDKFRAQAVNQADLQDIIAAQSPSRSAVADQIRADASKKGVLAGRSTSGDLDDLGVTAQPAQTTAMVTGATPTAADDMDDFGVVAQTNEQPGNKPVAQVQVASADPSLPQTSTPTQTASSHPGKEEDDKVQAQPSRPTTDVASATPPKPPNPTV